MPEVAIEEVLIPLIVYGFLELIRFYRERPRPHVIMIQSFSFAIQGREEPLTMVGIIVENAGQNALFDLQAEIISIETTRDAKIGFQKSIAKYGSLKVGDSKRLNLLQIRSDEVFAFFGHVKIRYRNSVNRVKYIQEIKFKGSSDQKVEGDVQYIISQHRDGGLYSLRSKCRDLLRKSKHYQKLENKYHSSKTVLSWKEPI